MDANNCRMDACELLNTALALVENMRYDINCGNINFCGFSDFYFSKKVDDFNASLLGKYQPNIKFIEHVCQLGEAESTTTSTTVPPIPKQLRIATGLVYENPVVVTRSLNNPITLNVPVVVGFNYFFISIPKGDNKIIRNPLNLDVTAEFSNIGDDVVDGYADNEIWKYSVKFYTGIASIFTITLS